MTLQQKSNSLIGINRHCYTFSRRSSCSLSFSLSLHFSISALLLIHKQCRDFKFCACIFSFNNLIILLVAKNPSFLITDSSEAVLHFFVQFSVSFFDCSFSVHWVLKNSRKYNNRQLSYQATLSVINKEGK